MRFLVVASRYPWPPYSGDRLRATVWIDALSALGEVTLVTAESPSSPRFESGVRIVGARASAAEFVSSAVRAIREGLPFHSLIAAGRSWAGAVRRAHEGIVRYDAAVILLSRLEPWIRGQVNSRRVILDAIDSLTASVAERSRQSSGAARWFWRGEIDRTRALEEALQSRYDHVVVVSEAERSQFGPRTIAIPMGVEIFPLAGDEPRRYAFGFWGRLGYFANRDAAKVLLEQIWPSIREAHPAAELLIAGADAPRELLRRSGKDGVLVQSPMNERPSLLRTIDVALFPIRYGTGQSTKLLEAGEAGCAIVGTPEAMRGLSHFHGAAIVRESPRDLAAAAIELFRDRDQVRKLGRTARHVVETHDSRDATLERMRSLATGGTV